jgi:hypothetical protein
MRTSVRLYLIEIWRLIFRMNIENDNVKILRRSKRIEEKKISNIQNKI